MRSRFPAVIPALALAALGACTAGTGSTTKVIVSTQIQPTSARAGDTVRIVVSVTNVTLVSATLETNTCDAPYDVLDSQGMVVGPGFDRACPSGSAPLLLDAGNPYDLTGFFTGLSSSSSPGNRVYLPAGNYSIRGKARIAEAGTIRGVPVSFRISP